MNTLPQGEAKVRAVREMFDAIAPRYDLVNRIMTFRMDVGWRRRTVRSLGLPPGSLVLDLACGTGDLCRELSAAGMRPVGMDLSFGMLRHARTSAPLAQADALRLPVPDRSVDGITCGFALRNFVTLRTVFAEEGGVPYQVVSIPGISEDVALLLAYEKGAELIVAVGTHFTLAEFLERDRAGMSSTFVTRLKVGEILIDAKGVSRLSSRRVGIWPLVLFTLAALAAVVVAVLASPELRDVIELLGSELSDLFA